MDIHKLRSEAVVDFEQWRKIRDKEKAKDELDVLLSSLREAQRARQFHFRPREVASVRWRGDIRLRGRDKSVENLKNHFSKIANSNGVTSDHTKKVSELKEVKDEYRSKWRGSSINNNVKRLSTSSKSDTLPRTKSSLTPQQVNLLKGQLTEILEPKSYEVQVKTVPSQSKTLFVKPLKSQQEIETEQKELSFKIGQEIKSRQNFDQQKPRDFDQADKNDFLLVLTSPTSNEEVKASMESWTGTKNEEERPKSVNEVVKSFEEGLNKTSRTVSPLVETNVKVREVKRSFEKVPTRTSSFCKAIEQGQRCPSLGKLSKSTSSLENVLDDDKTLINEFSMSNPDISDSENPAVKSLREAFKTMGSQTWTSSSYLDPISPLMTNYKDKEVDSTKYSRAYLTLVKPGSVNNKLSKFEDPSLPRGYSQKTLNTTYKKSEKAKDYVAKHATDPRRVVIKTKEVGNVNDTIRRLEIKAKSPVPLPSTSADVVQVPVQPKMSLTWTDQKAKLKHFCKKMSHSKILNKMIALQCASQNQTLDKGTEKLLIKSTQEDLLKTVYQGGRVESKVDLFEKPPTKPTSPAPAWAAKPETYFSWSKRLNPSDTSSSAQKHNQFRKYYGYHPGDSKQPRSLLIGESDKAESQPASLPLYLENLPPPPPIRG